MWPTVAYSPGGTGATAGATAGAATVGLIRIGMVSSTGTRTTSTLANKGAVLDLNQTKVNYGAFGVEAIAIRVEAVAIRVAGWRPLLVKLKTEVHTGTAQRPSISPGSA